jgi:hypothetical protein
VNVLRIEVVTVRTKARADVVLEEETEFLAVASADVVPATDGPLLDVTLAPGMDEADDD